MLELFAWLSPGVIVALFLALDWCARRLRENAIEMRALRERAEMREGERARYVVEVGPYR